nr:transposase [uncultured archaeon]
MKLDKSRISKGKLATLQRLFLEGKWFINYVIANGITSFEAHRDYKVDSVTVKAGDKLEERKLIALSSQMKQALIKRLQDNVRALAEQKKKGIRVGKIKFIKSLHSIR